MKTMSPDYRQIIENEYRRAAATPSDINEHLPLLRELAESVSSVTELGVRTGISTRAFLAADVRLHSIDLTLDAELQKLFAAATAGGCDATYTQSDVLAMDIDETDFLFIDTWHTYAQLSAELKRHAPQAKRYIAFHDTFSFGLRDEQAQESRFFMLLMLSKQILPFSLLSFLKKSSFLTRLHKILGNLLSNHSSGHGNFGLLPAILHYLADNPGQWQIKIHKTNNNGLTVLERIGS